MESVRSSPGRARKINAWLSIGMGGRVRDAEEDVVEK